MTSRSRKYDEALTALTRSLDIVLASWSTTMVLMSLISRVVAHGMSTIIIRGNNTTSFGMNLCRKNCLNSFSSRYLSVIIRVGYSVS